MPNLTIAQPDVTLRLDPDGVIQEATFANTICDEGASVWVGQRWTDTLGDLGGDRVASVLENAAEPGTSSYLKVTQRFPSGRELPMEYTTIRLSGRAGLVAVGRSLQAVAELRSGLIASQRALERDYWKLRDIETRYRLLFDTSNEAVVVISGRDFNVLEANPAAIRSLRLGPTRNVLSRLGADEQAGFKSMLDRVRRHGRAPGLLVHVGSGRAPWMVRASVTTLQPEENFLLQLTPVGAPAPVEEPAPSVSVEALLDRLPDSFVVIDHAGIIRRANQAFLDLVQVGADDTLLGQSIGRWLSHPGADLATLLTSLRKRRIARRFSTTIHGEHGGVAMVELSAVGDAEGKPKHFALLIRHIGLRLVSSERERAANGLTAISAANIRRVPLRRLVADAVESIEKHYIEAALETADGNRSAAAQLLGLSRQTLYEKLSRYGLDGHNETAEHSSG